MSKSQDTLVTDIQEQAEQHLAEGLQETEPSEELEVEEPLPLRRLAAVASMPTLAAAVMAGGVFVAFSARIWAAIAGLLGVGIAAWAYRIRKPMNMNALILAGLFGIGILLTIPAGDVSDVLNIDDFVKRAVREGNVNRPPVEFTIGWRAILGWLMGGVGFAAGWTAIELKKPAFAMMLPLPIVAITAISVPKGNPQVVSGLVALVLFAIGLGLLSSTRLEGEEDEKPSLAYEVRRGGKAMVMLAIVTGVLFFLATETKFLFPPPRIDPATQPKRPQTRPITDVPDRVLFTVHSQVSGPWRIGGLDVYDGTAWLLPPISDSKLARVPRSGIVDDSLNPGVSADFEIEGLGGAVLPGIPNLVGVKAVGPPLSYDSRTGALRLAQGTIERGLRYTVTAALIPSIDDLLKATAPPPRELEVFTRMPNSPPPPSVRAIMDTFTPTTSPWEKFSTLRDALLKNVSSAGAGSPKDMRPEDVERMMQPGGEGTPYEIVAAQAMMARWVGIPSRIGYGFDGGEKADPKEPTCKDGCEVRPKHGATYVEVFFRSYGWLPVVGTPLKSNTNVNSNPKNDDPSVLPSDEISVRVFVPIATDPRNFLFEQIRAVMLVVVPILLMLLLIYYTFPALRKAVRRARRRTWALNQGPAARVALAYAEWRDLATDFGYRHDGDTPLMFLDRVVEDDEHTELAWLVTRTLWGDRRDKITGEDAAAAEELSRSLRRRLSQAHQGTLRVIAAVSRLSVRHPYAPELGGVPDRQADRKEGADEPQAA